MSAIRLARAATGREKLLKFAGAYHGHVDGLLAAGGLRAGHAGHPVLAGRARRRPPRRRSSCRGTTPTRCARPSPSTSSRRCWSSPIPANMGLIPPAPGFLELLRDLCTGYDALLVFDEVITGFRVAPGGAQELTGVLPDLTVMGKIIGGGLPAAAFGGSAALMERIAPAGDVYQAGTLSGNPLAVAAGRADARAARRAGLPVAQRHHARAGRRPARGGGRPPGLRHLHHGPRDRLLRRRAADGLRGRRRLRPRDLRRLVPRAAGPRRLSARLAVRGLVPVHRPHRPSTSPARSRRPPRRSPRSPLTRCSRGVVSDACTGSRRSCATEGGLLAGTVARSPARRSRTATPSPAAARAIPLLVEAIREGYLQHYASGRVVQPEDPDLALLAGDRLYALGLERLAGDRRPRRGGRAGGRDRAVRAGARRGRSGARRGRLGRRGARPSRAVRLLTTRPPNDGGAAPDRTSGAGTRRPTAAER